MTTNAPSDSLTAAATPATDHQEHGNDEPTGKPQPIAQYTDGHAYEVPRPFLTLEQAGLILGKSIRALERSLLGRWGNKLPDGWVGRKMHTENGQEWRILPPPGFRVRLTADSGTEFDTTPEDTAEFANQSVVSDGGNPDGMPMTGGQATSNRTSTPGSQLSASSSNSSNSAHQIARKKQWKPERHTLDQPTIVIERTEEVENLLRELVNVQKSLSEERRMHMEDLRMITQLQSSMRLLEVNAMELSRAKSELDSAKQELSEWKKRYNAIVEMPWWRRVFNKFV
jgi:hypothetical protein